MGIRSVQNAPYRLGLVVQGLSSIVGFACVCRVKYGLQWIASSSAENCGSWFALFSRTRVGLPFLVARPDDSAMLVLMWSIGRFVNMFVDPNLSSQTSPLREIYVSTDIETDGPVAGKHSMLSIGSAAYLADKELLGTFSANLETLPASAPDPRTAAWWATHL